MEGNRRERRAWRNAALLIVAGLTVAGFGARSAGQGKESAPAPPVKALPRPPFAATPSARGKGKATGLRLVKVSERRNAITDTPAWFAKHGTLPAWGVNAAADISEPPPEDLPGVMAGLGLATAIREKKRILAIYGEDASGGRIVAGFDPKRSVVDYAFDFRSYLMPPRFAPQDRAFIEEKVQWAAEDDTTLYVSNFHRTYARSSRGRNGYITAIDRKTRKLRWRSRPLVCNTANFVLYRDVILTGYGFTREPDYLYVLDRRTGAVRQSLRLRSGPEYILVEAGKDGPRVYVRAYDTDYVFRIVS